MMNILTPSERVARIINMITPYGIWYSLTVENEEAGDTRVMIHLEYCVEHPSNLVNENDNNKEEYNAMIHSMNIDWLDDTDETFIEKLHELHLYLQYCNLLSHKDNYYEISAKEKVKFIEYRMERHKRGQIDSIPL